jgi:DNA-binding NtrC family response regulator
MILNVLIAVDHPTLQHQIQRRLAREDVLVEVPRSRANVWKRVARETCDMCVLSKSLLPRPAQSVLQTLAQIPDAPAVVVVTERNDPEERAALIAAGAEEVLHAGLPTDQVVDVLEALLEKRATWARQRLATLRTVGQPRLADFVSSSPVMADFMDVVRRVVPGSASLLLLGETGVGKERLARAIHAEGPRGGGPFITINCGALPEALLESELFGHEAGAFTGASRTRRGYFELAHGGTIFLDEVGEMPLHLQVRLLRVLQDHEVQRVGGERPIRVDVRLMAATNRDLQERVEAGLFRKDLFFRLGVVSLTVPPLRVRRDDIPELVRGYLDYLRPRVGRDVRSIDGAALDALARYDWPGNVRELINVIERAMLLCAGASIAVGDLPEAIRGAGPAPAPAAPAPGDGRRERWAGMTLAAARAEWMAELERDYLSSVLAATRGRVGEAAARAGITPRALYGKMRRHGLRKEPFRTA